MSTASSHRLLWALFALLIGGALAATVPFDGSWWQVVLLGAVQGVTEWLPISSTAHLLLTADLLGFTGSIGGTFEIAIQLGTVLSVITYYAHDLRGQVTAVLGRADAGAAASARRFWLQLLVAFLPAAVVGLLARDLIKSVLYESAVVIGSALVIGGLVFLWVERRRTAPAAVTGLPQVSFLQALLIGCAQVLALVPGVSRSGASIVGGRLVGLDRATATAFSFYLAIPTLGAATLVDLLGSLDLITAADWGRLALGAAVAYAVGWLTIGWLLRFLRTSSFVPFGWYRIIVGGLLLLLAGAGVIQ
jgi:undecaprenyl-diphosphatase